MLKVYPYSCFSKVIWCSDDPDQPHEEFLDIQQSVAVGFLVWLNGVFFKSYRVKELVLRIEFFSTQHIISSSLQLYNCLPIIVFPYYSKILKEHIFRMAHQVYHKS